MLSKRIHNTLYDIALTTYPDSRIAKFFVVLENKELITKNGDYKHDHKTKKSQIRVVNLSRSTHEIIKTSIHELAHHVEVSFFNETGHNSRFYGIYKKLLETSIIMGIISYEEIKSIRDIKILESHHGAINVKFDPKMEYKKDKVLVKVFNSYSVKDILSNKGYEYCGHEQVWWKEFHKDSLEDEESFLYDIIDRSNVKITKMNEVEIDVLNYVLVGNCYKYIELLKANDYIWQGYNHKGRVWVKKINSTQLNNEYSFLNTLPGIDIKIKGVEKKFKKKENNKVKKD